MKWQWIILCFLFIFSDCEAELKLVMIFLRHGARAARNDEPHFDKRLNWWMGKNMLTPSGDRQHYLLGRMMRKKYIEELDFLPAKFNESLVKIWSTQQDRTLRSASSFALGLYNSDLDHLNDKQVREEKLWLPPLKLTLPDYIKKELKDSSLPLDIPVVPIVALNKSYDRFLAVKSCQRYGENRKLYYSSEKFKEVFNRYKEDFFSACEKLGMSCKKVKQKHVWNYADWIVTSAFDQRLPELEEYPDLVEKMDEFYTEMEHGELVMEPFMIPLGFNGFSIEVPNQIEKVIKGEIPVKFIVYSTHESSILSYLIAMGVDKEKLYKRLPFATNLRLEILKAKGAPENELTSYTVNLTFNSHQVLEIMDFPKFKEFLKQKGKLDQDWEQLCKPHVNSMFILSSESSSFLFYGSALAGIFIIGVIILFSKNQYRKSEDFSQYHCCHNFKL